jgi:hypothetical protein
LRRGRRGPSAFAGRRVPGWAVVAACAAAWLAACVAGNSAPAKEPSCSELGTGVFLDSADQGHYRVIAPNGGESYHVGDTLEVVVASGVNDSEALIQLAVTVNGVIRQVQLPGLPPRAINPRAQCRIRFRIPDSLGTGTGARFSLVSDSVRIRISWYSFDSVRDFSDGYFRITR